jgi:hypothetical protein
MGDRNVMKGGALNAVSSLVAKDLLEKAPEGIIPEIKVENLKNLETLEHLDKSEKVERIKSKIKEHNTEQNKWYHFSPLTAPRPEENANKLATQVYNETKDTSNTNGKTNADKETEIGQTIKDIDTYRYDHLWPMGLFGKTGSHIQWWIGRIFMFFINCILYIIFFIIILIVFVMISVIIGVINLGLEGVHGTLTFVSKIMGGLNKIAMGALTVPKRKVDNENKKIPKNAIELIILIGVQLVTNPMPLIKQLKTIIMGIKNSF